MGHTTRISDYELERAQTRGPEVDGVDIEADREKPKPKPEPKPEPKAEAPVTTSKVVEPEKKAAPRKTTARTKAK